MGASSSLWIPIQFFVDTNPALCGYQSSSLWITIQFFVDTNPVLCRYQSSSLWIPIQFFVDTKRLPHSSTLKGATCQKYILCTTLVGETDESPLFLESDATAPWWDMRCFVSSQDLGFIGFWLIPDVPVVPVVPDVPVVPVVPVTVTASLGQSIHQIK